MFSSSAFGAQSNTRRFISRLTKVSPKPAAQSAVTSGFTIPADLIRAFNGERRIRLTSTGYRRSRRPEPGRCSTYQPEIPVQTNPASSVGTIEYTDAFDEYCCKQICLFWDAYLGRLDS